VFIARGAIQKPWIFSELSDPSFKVTYKQALIYLQAFHWLTRLWDEDSPETFLPCILEARLLNQNPCHESWLNFLDYLKAYCSARCEFTDKNTRRSLARTKMVWSYMRMNWSETSMLPGPLRADGFETMMDELERIEIEDT
jgi:tRNA-dihydrouridine synthase